MLDRCDRQPATGRQDERGRDGPTVLSNGCGDRIVLLAGRPGGRGQAGAGGRRRARANGRAALDGELVVGVGRRDERVHDGGGRDSVEGVERGDELVGAALAGEGAGAHRRAVQQHSR